MSVEQVARDFISNMTNGPKVKSMLTADAMASGGVLPQAMPARDAFDMISGLNAGFPDLKFEVKDVKVNGDQATVKANVTGTNTGTLKLPMPGMAPIPPTGKKVSTPDVFIVTVQGDKVSHMTVDSPSDGGIPAMLGQLGIKLPGM